MWQANHPGASRRCRCHPAPKKINEEETVQFKMYHVFSISRRRTLPVTIPAPLWYSTLTNPKPRSQSQKSRLRVAICQVSRNSRFVEVQCQWLYRNVPACGQCRHYRRRKTSDGELEGSGNTSTWNIPSLRHPKTQSMPAASWMGTQGRAPSPACVFQERFSSSDWRALTPLHCFKMILFMKMFL